MKQAFLLCAVLFAAMYITAQATLKRPANDGVVRLRWATDPNPARNVQTGLFNEMYPGTTVSVDPSAGGDISKLLVQCATGTGPDIIDLQQETMNSLVDTGVLLDLTPYAKSMGFDASRTYPAIKASLEVEGKQYRFPCNVFADAVIYNKKIFDDHGVPYPKPGWTYDDFIRTSKMLIERPSKSGEKHLAVANWSSGQLFKDFLMGHGGRQFTPDGLHSAIDSPEAIAALRQYYDMMYTHKILPTPADAAAMSSQGGWGSGGLNWFSGSKAAMIIIGRWYIVQVPNFPELQGNLGAVIVPRVGNRPSSSIAGTRAAGINANSPRREEALKFLQYLASPQYSRVIAQDGDALPPSPQAATPQALANEMVPDPAFHAAFLQAADNARPLDYSPFMDAMQAARWIQEAIDKTENRLITPEAALHAVAAQINQQIRLNLERQPNLQKLYEQRTGKPYRPDWQ